MADLLISTLGQIKNDERFNRYDPELCSDVHARLDKELKENGYGIKEKTEFVSLKINTTSDKSILFVSRQVKIWLP